MKDSMNSRKYFLLVTAAVGTLGVVFLTLSAQVASPLGDAGAESFRPPALPFAGEPRGPYATGTIEELWVNEALDDPSTVAPDKRKIMVQIWYPASLPRNPRLAPYAISPQLYWKKNPIHEIAQVQTQSILDAPLLAQPGRLPILVYNHGGGRPHFCSTFQTEFLASHGYVVVSIGHSGENGIERFPDRTSYKSDSKPWDVRPDPHLALPLREKEEFQWVHSDLSLFVKDISFALDRVTALNADPRSRFHQRLDLERVGALGWSYGGVISLQALRDEPRIKAAANLDGWPYGLAGSSGVVTLGSERPVLLMFSLGNSGTVLTEYPGGRAGAGGEVDAKWVEASLAAATYYWTLLRRTTADWYHVTIARTNHGHFSDDTLFEPRDPQELHPRAAHAIINGYTLEFFDKYVRGSAQQTPLLSGEKRFPEATLLRRKKMQGESDR